MEAKKSKFKLAYELLNEHVVAVLIIISIILVIFSFFAPYFLTLNAKYVSLDFKDTGAIGDTVGGLMNPFIAMAGVSMTFLAFYMQYKANKIQVDNFSTEQKKQTELLQEQLFFRLVENLNQRVVNFSYSKSDNREVVSTSYDAIHSLSKAFKIVIDDKCNSFGRQLLAKYPDRVGDVQYRKILQANSLSHFRSQEEISEFRDKLINKNDFNERWEYLKAFIGSTDNKDSKVVDALKSIARVLFYKLDLHEKKGVYFGTYDDIYNDYGGFLDGYMKNLRYLLKFIENNDSNDFFIDYIMNNLSTQELVLIFYYCASRKSGPEFKRLVKRYDLLKDVHLARNSFIDSPSEEELSAEIEAILNFDEEEMLNFYQRKGNS